MISAGWLHDGIKVEFYCDVNVNCATPDSKVVCKVYCSCNKGGAHACWEEGILHVHSMESVREEEQQVKVLLGLCIPLPNQWFSIFFWRALRCEECRTTPTVTKVLTATS